MSNKNKKQKNHYSNLLTAPLYYVLLMLIRAVSSLDHCLLRAPTQNLGMSKSSTNYCTPTNLSLLVYSNSVQIPIYKTSAYYYA